MTAERQNNFGALRLALASLVVLSHAPELVDGNRTRELLTRAFGTLSFGEIAVDGFFLVSGYLILASHLRSASLADYLAKRVLRIVPAFAVAFLASTYLFAPLGGGTSGSVSVWQVLRGLLLLDQPRVPGAFTVLPYPFVNGALWTIPHEFRCYLLVPVLGALGILARRRRYALFLAALTLLYALRPEFGAYRLARALDLSNVVRLALMFAIGGAFHLWGKRIRYTGRKALLAIALLVPAMFSPRLAEPAFALCGGYLLFGFALRAPPTRLSLALNRRDPSYGLYLYAWPIQSLMVLYAPALSPWAGAGATWLVAFSLGLLSWHLVEAPALAQVPRLAQVLGRLRLPRRRLPAPA